MYAVHFSCHLLFYVDSSSPMELKHFLGLFHMEGTWDTQCKCDSEDLSFTTERKLRDWV